MVVLMRLWCGKLQLSKPYLGLATQTLNRCFSSRGGGAHIRRYHLRKIIPLLERDVTDGGRKWTHYPIERDYRLSVSQGDALESFDSLCNQGNSREAIEVLEYLEIHKGYVMDLIRLFRLAKLCSEPEAIEEAKIVHEYIIAALDSPSSRNAIIDMYSGCRSVDDAMKVFDEMSEKSLETWCVMMRCFVNNGLGDKALDLFTRFKDEGNKPNGDVFNEVFNACISIENFREGLLQFEAMRRDYGIVPSMEHYNSVTKMLATSGLLEEAMSFVERMPIEPSVDVWETLMNLSRVHGDLELGDRCAYMVEKLDSTRLDKMSSVGLVAATKALDFAKKEPSYRSRAKDASHPETDTIYNTLKCLHTQMLEMGYDLETFKLPTRHEAVENEKKERIFGYKEEVAVAKGLLSTRPRSSVTVLINIRICPDSHNALKLMSVITGRVLIKRDNKRYHHFENGVCSCNDYW